MPAVCVLLYRKALQRSATLPYMQGEEPASGWSFPVRPVILLATFTLANNFVRHFLDSDFKGTVLLGVMLAAAFVIVLLLWRGARFDLGVLYAFCLPLVVAGSLCVLIALPGVGTVGAILTNAAYTLFSIFVTVLLCSISYRYGVDAPWLFGIANASISLGSLAAGFLGGQIERLGGGSLVLTLVVSAVVVVFACLYVTFSGKDMLAGSWGITRPGPEGREVEDNGERLARAARVHGLTRREEEVLVLLVGNASFAQIEEDLAISNSTLKTHARHIYAKFDVSGRHELAEACGVAPRLNDASS